MASDQRIPDAITGAVGSVVAPAFDLHFPLPYRICGAILLGIWGWGLNVKILTSAHVDVGYLVKYNFIKAPGAGSAPRSFHQGIFHMATVLTIGVVSSWLLFGLILLKQYDNVAFSLPATTSKVRAIDILPASTLFMVLISFFLPSRNFHSAGRRRFLEILRRILLGRLDLESRFPDVLVADALTSYTRVMLDLAVTVCMFVHGKSFVGAPDRASCSGPLVMGVILSMPYVIRFRQCTIDYSRTGANTHIVNCMKYLSALPVVIFGVLQQVFKGVEADQGGFTEAWAYRMWVIAAFVNSFYSFIWDLTCDWNMELLTRSIFTYRYRGLRKVLFLRPTSVYYLAILVDFSIRMLWTHKLTTNWAGFGDLESGLYTLEILEIVRRGVWMCLRMEKEWLLTSKDPVDFAVLEMDELNDRTHNN